MTRSAVISECGLYRYRLYREWATSPLMPVMWIMLNPSTADADIDDPTIRRCMAFSKAWGYGAMWVGNLFAFRATRPEAMACSTDPAGPANVVHLNAMAGESARIVCAWGGHWMAANAERDTLELVVQPGGLWCLGKTKSGAPRHPLYVKGDTEPQPWP